MPELLLGSALTVASPTEAMDRTNMEGPAVDREAAARSRDDVERRAAIVGDGLAAWEDRNQAGEEFDT